MRRKKKDFTPLPSTVGGVLKCEEIIKKRKDGSMKTEKEERDTSLGSEMGIMYMLKTLQKSMEKMHTKLETLMPNQTPKDTVSEETSTASSVSIDAPDRMLEILERLKDVLDRMEPVSSQPQEEEPVIPEEIQTKTILYATALLTGWTGNMELQIIIPGNLLNFTPTEELGKPIFTEEGVLLTIKKPLLFDFTLDGRDYSIMIPATNYGVINIIPPSENNPTTTTCTIGVYDTHTNFLQYRKLVGDISGGLDDNVIFHNDAMLLSPMSSAVPSVGICSDEEDVWLYAVNRQASIGNDKFYDERHIYVTFPQDARDPIPSKVKVTKDYVFINSTRVKRVNLPIGIYKFISQPNWVSDTRMEACIAIYEDLNNRMIYALD